MNLQAQNGDSPDPSLKLHYDFDENFSSGVVSDVSGNGNDGLQFNPANWITAANGVFGSPAAQFTYAGFISNDPPHVYPLSQYIAVTNLNGIEYLTNATISFWAWFQATNNQEAVFILDNGYSVNYASNPSAASNSWTLWRANYGNHLYFSVNPASGGSVNLVDWPSDISRSGTTANFNLYSVTIDCPGNQIISYYDGQPYMTNTINLPWLHIYGCATQRWLCVGAMSHQGTPQWGDDRYPNSGYFVGALDDLRIFNRTLSATEVQALYTGSVFAANVMIAQTNLQSVQISWNTQTNVHYQPESEADLNTNGWAALGSVVAGNGATNSISDSMADQPAQFYRVRVLAK